MRRFLVALTLAWALPIAAFASATITDLLGFERQATVKLDLPEGKGHGSGVIIDNGKILTAAHVAGRWTKLLITLEDGTQYIGTVSWISPGADLATVDFPAPPGLHSATLTCRDLKQGEPVSVLGYPLVLPLSVTRGVVMSTEHVDTGDGPPLIAVDAMIAPGDSGGPVFDAQGQVIGISDKAPENSSFGLMIPINVSGRQFCRG